METRIGVYNKNNHFFEQIRLSVETRPCQQHNIGVS